MKKHKEITEKEVNEIFDKMKSINAQIPTVKRKIQDEIVWIQIDNVTKPYQS